MNKASLILKYFQKKDKLTVKNPAYGKALDFLFHWLKEFDKADNDVTSRLLDLKGQANGKIISREEGIIAGQEEIVYLTKKHTSLFYKTLIKDGDKIKKNQTAGEIKGPVNQILAYERTILNILQRMSGIATETNDLVNIVNSHLQPKTYNLKPFIAATRKTPWMALDKKAVAAGGGLTHRLDLADGILIKDNHLFAIKNSFKIKTNNDAIRKILGMMTEQNSKLKTQNSKPQLKSNNLELVEIEVTSASHALTALQTWDRLQTRNPQPATRNYLAIMFDNFSPNEVKTLLANLSDLERNQVIFEASGGITADNLPDWAKTGVDIISVGALTHSSKAINFSLETSVL